VASVGDEIAGCAFAFLWNGAQDMVEGRFKQTAFPKDRLVALAKDALEVVMSSLRQIEANRRNARLSTDPVTDAGKEKSRRNALRHGLTAETVIHALEDKEDYTALNWRHHACPKAAKASCRLT
jgi:hypothetical protein